MIQRRAVVCIAGAATTALLAGCGFDSPAVTEHEHNSTQAHDFSVGQIRVRDTYVTTVQSASASPTPTSSGAVGLGPTSSTTAGGATSYLVVSLVNQGKQPDTLTAISSPEASVALSGSGVSGGSLTVPPNGIPVVVSQPLMSPTGPTATLTASTTPALGTYVPMQFTFSRAGTSATEPVPVIPPNETTSPTSPVPQTHATPPPVPGESATD